MWKVSPAWLEGRPEVPHFTGSLLGGKGVIPAPTLLLMDVKSGSLGREREKALESAGEGGWGARIVL